MRKTAIEATVDGDRRAPRNGRRRNVYGDRCEVLSELRTDGGPPMPRRTHTRTTRPTYRGTGRLRRGPIAHAHVEAAAVDVEREMDTRTVDTSGPVVHAPPRYEQRPMRGARSTRQPTATVETNAHTKLQLQTVREGTPKPGGRPATTKTVARLTEV
jgi:hypothetical protein